MDHKKRTWVQKFQDWAPTQSDLIAIALVGSCARGTDSLESDIDLVLITRDPQHYLRSIAWAARFGDITSETIEDYGKMTSWRVFYRDGVEVEFGITVISWISMPLDAGTRLVLKDGIKILFEKNGELSAAIKFL